MPFLLVSVRPRPAGADVHGIRQVLYLACSPDGQTIVTGAGDETLRFWSAFPKSKTERKSESGALSPFGSIR